VLNGFLRGNLFRESLLYFPAKESYIFRAHFQGQLRGRFFANLSTSKLWFHAVALKKQKWLSFSVDPTDRCRFLTRLLKRHRSPQVALFDHGPRLFTSLLKFIRRSKAPIMLFWKIRKIRHDHCGSKGHYIGHHARHISRPIPCLASSHPAPYPHRAHAFTRVRQRRNTFLRMTEHTLAHTSILKKQIIAQANSITPDPLLPPSNPTGVCTTL
jgi:hypothetical protein